LLGVIRYAIDLFADICNQNTDDTFQGSFMIDHNVISLKIDLELLCHGKLASLKEPFRPTRVVLPKARSQEPKDVAGRIKLSKLIQESAATIPTSILDAFSAGSSIHDRAHNCNALEQELQSILGDKIPKEFTAKPKRSSSKQCLNEYLRARMTAITYTNKCIKYTHRLRNNLLHGSALSDYRKQWVLLALQNLPSDLVEFPQISKATILNSPQLVDAWLLYSKMLRKKLWREFRTEEKRLQRERR
jgi:hypothetical protein